MGLQDFLSFYIITGNLIDNKGAFQGIQVVVYRIQINFTLLAFEVVGHVLGREFVADIIKHEPDHSFQQLHITDCMPLHRIAGCR